MLLKTILNRVERHKSFVYDDGNFVTDAVGNTSIEVRVTARANGRPVCSGCRRPGPGYDRLAERRFEYVPLWAIPVFLLYALRRVDCPRCGVTVEQVPWAEGKSTLTNSYRWFLDEWCQRAMRSRIEPMKKMARTLRKHSDLLLNWFRAEGAISSGTVEGFNNKAKLTMRKAYGFRTANAIKIALFHNLGDLPEPKLTHRFC